MISRALATLALAAALALVAPVLAGGNVWVSDSGGRHDVGDNVMFLGQGSTLFDLADLADGETRVFGSGAKQISATREGDVVRLDRDPADGERGVSVSCHIGRDTCRVATFDDDPEKVALMIEQVRECIDGIGDCDGHFSEHGTPGARIMIKKLVGCDEADADCELDMAELLADGAELEGHSVVELLSDGDTGGVHDIRIMPMGGHAEAFFTDEDADTFDVSELLDGETRIFGFGDNRVTAFRSGDEVRITRQASGDKEAMTSTCRIGTDTCRILTFEDDPERVMVLVTKRRNCVDGDCDVDVLHLGLGGAPGMSRTMRIHTGRDVMIFDEADGGSHRHSHHDDGNDD